MDKIALLDKLDKATDRGAHLAINNGFPIRLSKKSTMIGGTIIEKSDNGFFNIISNKSIIYKNISIFDIAVIIAQRYNSGEISIIHKVLALEERFSKHHNDMIHYLNCLKSAKKKNDLDRMAILEDKFQIAESLAKSIRDKIAIFKKVR